MPPRAKTAKRGKPAKPATTAITFRSPGEGEVRAFLKPLSLAFGEVLSPEELDHEARHLEPDRMIGAFDGDEQVGMAGAYTMRITVPGGEVGAAGITAVGVVPSHTRRGILRHMMTWLMDQARDRSEPIAILMASEAAIYQRFGYGLSTLQSRFDMETIRARFLHPVESRGRVRIVDQDEAVRRFPKIFDAVRRRTPGAQGRNEHDWRWANTHDAEWMRRGTGHKTMAILEVGGKARAYAIYRIKADWSPRGPTSTMTVIEVIGLEPASEQEMWQWLFRVDLVATITTTRGPMPHPLLLQLSEPRRLGLTVGDATWLRILDVDKALEARSYVGSGAVTFDVSDDFCPWNAGRWRLSVPGSGRVTVKRSKAAPDVTLGVAALGSLYLGGFSFAELAAVGQVIEHRRGGIARADALFTTSRNPWNSDPF